MAGDDARLDGREVALDDVEIGAADAAGQDLEQHLSGLRLRPREIFDRNPTAGDARSGIEYGCSHGKSSNHKLSLGRTRDAAGLRSGTSRRPAMLELQSSHAMALRVAIAGDWAMPANSLPCFVAPPFDPFPLVSSGGSAAASSYGVLSAAHILCGLQDALRPAEIAPIAFIRAKGDDLFSLGRETQIGVDDGKAPSSSIFAKMSGREDVDAGKGQRLHLRGRPHQFSLPGFRLRCAHARRPQSWPCSSKSR